MKQAQIFYAISLHLLMLNLYSAIPCNVIIACFHSQTLYDAISVKKPLLGMQQCNFEEGPGMFKIQTLR